MPNPSDVEKKIDILAEIAVMDYGIGVNKMRQLVEQAKKINNHAIAAMFESTDVFMGEDGTFSVVASLGGRSVRISISNDEYEVVVDRNRKLIDFANNQTEQQAISYLDSWGRLWHSYAFYPNTPMIQVNRAVGLTHIHSGEAKRRGAYQSSIPSAWIPKETIYASS